jgi:hypothetical protein
VKVNGLDMKRVLFLPILLVVGCATPRSGPYDPNAIETMGVVIERQATGNTTQQINNESMLIPAGKIFIPFTLSRSSGALPVFEHRIALEDGRTVTVLSWYAYHLVGNCVKLFESPRSDYPRLINSSECKAKH